MRYELSLVAAIALLAGSLVAQGDFQKGISYYKQGQFDKAVEEFEKIVAEDPDYEAGYRVLGDSYLKLRDFSKAARAFQRAAELERENFVSYIGAAIAEFNLRRFQECVATLLRGEPYARTPRERYQLHQLRGSAYYSLGRYREAAEDLDKAVAIQRGEYSDVLQLGVAYYQLGEYGRARIHLEQARNLNPTAAEPQRFLSRLEYRDALDALAEKRFTEAGSILQRHLEAQPNDAEAWYNLGLARLFAENLDGAQAAFRRSLELSPDNWEAYNRLGYIYEVKRRYQDSLRNYRRALELHRDGAIRESVERIEERLRRQIG